MKAEDLCEVTQKMKIGDKLTFKHNFEKWRAENNISSLDQKILFESRIFPSSSSTSIPSSQSSEEIESSTITAIHILKHQIGRKIIQQYKKANTLADEHRAKIVKIIVQYFDFNNISMTLQTSYRLETEILEIFPTEKIQFYRTERRGKIYIKFHNNKKHIKLPNIETSKISSSPKIKEKLVPEEDALISLQSLKFDNLSADEFKSNWAACANFRINQIRHETENMHESLKLWPQYKRPNGMKLIDVDFGIIHKDAEKIINSDEKFGRLFEYMKNHLNLHDKDAKKVMNTLEKIHLDQDQDICCLKILWCLHSYLYPTKQFPRKDVNGKQTFGRFSIRDSQGSFIYINETMQSLDDHIHFLSNKGEPIQPFILGLGSKNQLNITQFYVYLDGQLISFNNFRRALDICFKSFHLFNVKYPLASLPFWIFIEKFLYGIDGSDMNAKVSAFIAELSTMQ